MGTFDQDSKFMQVTMTMLDYLKLGLLFMLFSIPVIPMGAAASAALTVGMKIARGEAPAVWRPFWAAFKENFKQGTVLLLIFGLIFGLLAFDWYQVMTMDTTALIRVARAGIVLLALLAVSIALYSFALIARYTLPIRGVLRNAVIYTLIYFPRNLLTVAIVVAGIVGYVYATPVVPLIVSIVPSVLIWYFSKTCVKAFRTSEQRRDDPGPEDSGRDESDASEERNDWDGQD